MKLNTYAACGISAALLSYAIATVTLYRLGQDLSGLATSLMMLVCIGGLLFEGRDDPGFLMSLSLIIAATMVLLSMTITQGGLETILVACGLFIAGISISAFRTKMVPR